jgi:RNA polymerase sigma-70 factor (ECF subfamily)
MTRTHLLALDQGTDDLDGKLIQATLLGNRQSFNELIQKHQPTLYVMIHRHIRQREETEDIVQQVFIKAYVNLDNFRGDSKFFTWLYTIALNVIRNHTRQRKIRRMESLDGPVNTDGKPAPQWPDKTPSVEKIAQDRWDVARVRAALETLADPHRAIFALHYFQYLSLKEVAERLKRPLGTVKVYLHRARKMVLRRLVTSSDIDMSNPL